MLSWLASLPGTTGSGTKLEPGLAATAALHISLMTPRLDGMSVMGGGTGSHPAPPPHPARGWGQCCRDHRNPHAIVIRESQPASFLVPTTSCQSVLGNERKYNLLKLFA